MFRFCFSSLEGWTRCLFTVKKDRALSLPLSFNLTSFGTSSFSSLGTISMNTETVSTHRYPTLRVSKSACGRRAGIQDAIQRSLNFLLQTCPRGRVALVTFNDEVTVYGDGTGIPLMLKEWELMDFDFLMSQGQQFTCPRCVEESIDTLRCRVQEMREHGSTALGPAALVSIAMASRYSGSKVNIVNINNVSSEIQSVLEDNVIATNVKATFLIAEGMLVKEIGNVTEDLEITFQFGIKESSLQNFLERDKVPFQLQLDFKTRDLQRATRILSLEKSVAPDSSLVKDSLNVAVLGVHCAQLTARLTMDGRVREAHKEVLAQRELLQDMGAVMIAMKLLCVYVLLLKADGRVYPGGRKRGHQHYNPPTPRHRSGPHVCSAGFGTGCCPGWVPSSASGLCLTPVCSFGCGDGFCIAPNVCSCRGGKQGVTCPDEGWLGHLLAEDIFNRADTEDRDECQAPGPARCQQRCVNTPGSYSCTCRHGYRLSSDGRTCADINECHLHPPRCQHLCQNVMGSYHCTCPVGYQLLPDGKRCEAECVYQGNVYLEGAEFSRPGDDCTTCVCKNGEVECSYTPCPVLDCPRGDWRLEPGECCFSCHQATVERGCSVDDNGVEFPVGQIWSPGDPCETCMCQVRTEWDCNYEGRKVLNGLSFTLESSPCTQCTCQVRRAEVCVSVCVSAVCVSVCISVVCLSLCESLLSEKSSY
ncbi:von Willebrand factor C and EGF domain-containing protein [Acipenser ruthenus]|uniref:von Willebrand factor C and EGF domain-containing protein n=1 Tax=Acipenser ruthenus TaxID=7906 RepID=A0A444UMJ3_ACIRT|nr:von Willebrand factor C and EGF domain-containing protein [Acipenser ruthenus]